MNEKYLIGYDPNRLNNSFSYVSLMNMMQKLTQDGLDYTFDKDGYYTDALFGSAEDCGVAFAKLHSNCRISIIALSDPLDLTVKADHLQLSQTAFTLYPKVDNLYVFSESQVAFLKALGITKNVRLVKPTLTFPNDDVSPAERSSFRSFYQVPLDRIVIFSYGSYTDKSESKTMETIARLNPEMSFFFFGHNDREYVKEKTNERMTRLDNMHYLNSLPQELYHSALLSADCLLFTTKFIAYLNIVFDAISHKMPIVAYKTSILKDILTPETALLPQDFPALYQTIKNIKTVNKAKEAKEALDKALGNLA
ncbi:MAG: hypothetical protein LKM30_03990 [Bacilli bacterium]|jgi:hypothetical protein|nr:hypothetical protein [Bacilli bacterium]